MPARSTLHGQTASNTKSQTHVSWPAVVAVLLLIAIAVLAGLFGGPDLGDHEAIVAQCARNMRITGDWVVPHIFDVPFFRKPPLPYWLVAAASYVLPNDAATGLPVTTLAARLPSALAAMVTVLLIWRLSSSMFGRRIGRITAAVSGSSLTFLLYAPNATAEMLLTMCCTWAYLHFWYTVTARRAGPRFVHAMLFYVAMGCGMLAKGPAPIALVAMPLVVWWFTERPLRVLARSGLTAWRQVMMCFVKGLWPRTRQAFTRLWLLPGLVVFAAIFIPWMLAVAQRYPHAWDLWNWQYWQRAQGNYEDTRVRGPFYYIPIVIGLTLPWAFLLVEALAAPWLKRYWRQHRALLYVGMWAVLATAVMSRMQFKKSYYTLPAMPGLLILLGVVADRLYSWRVTDAPLTWTVWLGRNQRTVVIANLRQWAWILWGGLAAAGIAGVIVAGVRLSHTMEAVWLPLTVITGAAVAGLLLASASYIRGRGWAAMGITAVTMVAAFHGAWYTVGPAVDVIGGRGEVADLAQTLDAAHVSPQVKVLWADSRPDARLAFYYDRRTSFVVTPEEIVSQMVDRTQQGEKLQMMVMGRALGLLKGSEPVYLILRQKHYWLVKDSLPQGCRVVELPQEANTTGGRGWVVVTNVG